MHRELTADGIPTGGHAPWSMEQIEYLLRELESGPTWLDRDDIHLYAPRTPREVAETEEGRRDIVNNLWSLVTGAVSL